MAALKKIANTLGILLLLIIGAVVLLLASPFIAVFLWREKQATAKEREEFNQFLAQNEGACFFVYNNKRSVQQYIETVVLPQLPQHVKVICSDGHLATSISERYLLNSCNTQGGMPYVVVITNGQPVATSVNNRLYAAIQHNDAERVLAPIRVMVG